MENKLGIPPEAFCLHDCKFNRQCTDFYCSKIEMRIQFGLKKCKEGDEELVEETEE